MTGVLEQAKAALEITADIARTNAPINEAEGNLTQAQLERKTIEDCEDTLRLLEIDTELATIEKEMHDPGSAYYKGRLAEGKQARYRELLKVKHGLLK